MWTGRQAKQLGLVDELGGLERAIAIAKERAKIPQDDGVELVVYPPHKSIYEIVANPFGRSDGATALGAILGLKDPRGLQIADRAAPDLPARRAAGADAERVRPVAHAPSAAQLALVSTRSWLSIAPVETSDRSRMSSGSVTSWPRAISSSPLSFRTS